MSGGQRGGGNCLPLRRTAAAKETATSSLGVILAVFFTVAWGVLLALWVAHALPATRKEPGRIEPLQDTASHFLIRLSYRFGALVLSDKNEQKRSLFLEIRAVSFLILYIAVSYGILHPCTMSGLRPETGGWAVRKRGEEWRRWCEGRMFGQRKNVASPLAVYEINKSCSRSPFKRKVVV